MKFGPDKQLHHMDDYIFDFEFRTFQADTIAMQLLVCRTCRACECRYAEIDVINFWSLLLGIRSYRNKRTA